MPELVVSWIVLGTMAGAGVYLFSSKRLPGGLFGNIVVGIVGALIGGYLVTTATHADLSTSLTWGILLTSVVSALVVTIVAQSQASVRAKK